MLIEFRVENHRSLLTEQVLSMQRSRPADRIESGNTPIRPADLLPVAVLYGANASGKSNVLTALAFMQDAVLSSYRQWSPEEGVPRDPFAWGSDRDKPSLFEVSILVNGSRFDYGFTADDRTFTEEWLHAWIGGERETWFERDAQSFRFAEGLPGSNGLLEGLTRPNALFLSVASQHNSPQLSAIYSWFAALRTINMPISSRRLKFGSIWDLRKYVTYGGDLPDLIDGYAGTSDPATSDGTSLRGRFLRLLKDADTGIVGIKYNPFDPGESSNVSNWSEFLLKHEHDSVDAWLPIRQESQGTQTLFRIGLPILVALERGEALLVDELEKSLHPMLVREIVRQFNDPEINTRDAQLIFTTHDTNLLGNISGDPVFERDQIWLTEKDRSGATVLYPLSDYKPREAENLERGYLQGRYGAIPFLGNFSLSGE